MSTQIIGYVSTPFGQKGTTDFDELYKKAIHPAPNVAVAESDIILFREDGSRPPWQVHHEGRIERYRGGHRSHEWQLRQSIQDNIIGSDFLIAVLTDFNPNVMLEVGFAQSQKKIIVYVLYKDQFDKMPANLANLKRLQLYLTPEALKCHLYTRIQEVVDDIKLQHEEIRESGGFFLEYYSDRDSIGLIQKFRNARNKIQILTTNLTTVSANYIDSIIDSVNENPQIEVQILTSDPVNAFIDPRAAQLLEDKRGYRMELQGSLESISAKLKRNKNCEVKTYKDFPVQLWHRIDDRIYIGQSSLDRRTRHNCAFGINVETKGVKETYLDHFDLLWKNASPSQMTKTNMMSNKKTTTKRSSIKQKKRENKKGDQVDS